MKKIIFLVGWSYFLLGCNMSDDVISLPGGHKYVVEGPCTNRLFISLDNSPYDYIEPVKDCKFNEDFICAVTSDSISCSQDSIPIGKRKYTVIDVKKEKIFLFMNRLEYLSFWEKNIRDNDLKLE